MESARGEVPPNSSQSLLIVAAWNGAWIAWGAEVKKNN